MRKHLIGLMALFLALLGGTARAAVINEIQLGNTGVTSYIELLGQPGESLDNVTLIAIDSRWAAGRLNMVLPLAGYTVPADGHFLIGYGGTDYGSFFPPIPDVDLDVNLWIMSYPSTYMLVTDFSGDYFEDLDADKDGVLDVTPWTAVQDAVAVLCTSPYYGWPDVPYCAKVVGPLANDDIQHLYRSPDGGPWAFEAGAYCNGFSQYDTPGLRNYVLNSPPTDITLSASEVWQKSASGTVVGTLGAADPDAAESFTYAFAAPDGNAGGCFAIIGNQLVIKDQNLLDAKTASAVQITIAVTDSAGNTFAKNFQITVQRQQVKDKPKKIK